MSDFLSDISHLNYYSHHMYILEIVVAEHTGQYILYVHTYVHIYTTCVCIRILYVRTYVCVYAYNIVD